MEAASSIPVIPSPREHKSAARRILCSGVFPRTGRKRVLSGKMKAPLYLFGKKEHSLKLPRA
jgi:hypothetical protein